MIGMFSSLIIITIIASFYQLKLAIYSVLVIGIVSLFFYFNLITQFLFFTTLTPLSIIFLFLNFKKIRRHLFSNKLFHYFLNSTNQWQSFQRIDDGWLASDFERAIFQGKPNFIQLKQINSTQTEALPIEQEIHKTLEKITNNNHISQINALAKIGATALIIKNSFNGQNLSACEASKVLKNISKVNPVLASILGIINLDSLTSFLHHFGSHKQKKLFLPLLSKGKMLPFLKPTSLYETLESQKSSIEGRIEKENVNGTQKLGLRVSFQDIILLGTSQSNCFFINVNVKDFNNLHSNTTHLGTAICIIDKDIIGIDYQKGLKAYDDYLYYYACTGKNIFIPFNHIINESDGIGKGLEYLYRNQYYASSIWPLAVSIPINSVATLTSWYFAHLQKQNGRQLLSYKVVIEKLNEQFSQCLKLQLLDHLTLQNNLNPQLLKFTAILNKESSITQTMEQLGLLRGILGSNSHNIKTESKVRSFYKVAHLTTELDGMSHEINQLPLIKKAALACHPFFDKEVQLLTNKSNPDLNKFDIIIFQHIGYILQNLTRIWVYTLRTSLIGKILFPKNKYKVMIKRMSASFALLSDVTLINWTFKKKINTSFSSHLGQCIQQLTTSLAVYDYYATKASDEHSKDLSKTTLKNTLFACQKSLINTINLAFNRIPALFMKIILFPLGKPFHATTLFKPLHDDIEKICEFNENENDPYNNFSPFLKKIHAAKQQLKLSESTEIAVTNATGTPLNTDNYETLINRCLAAGIISVEQSEQLRNAYSSILEIKLTNHFGKNYYNKKKS